MLKKFKQMVGRIVDSFLERQWKKRHTQAIFDDEFFELEVMEYKIAEIIMKWCAKEREPVSYFLECLKLMGVESPILLKEPQETEEYNVVILEEKKNEKEKRVSISKTSKSDLILEQDDIKIQYDVYTKECPYKFFGENYLRILTIVLKDLQEISYCKDSKICCKMGDDIYIRIEEVNWEEDLNLYANAISLIKELQTLEEKLSIISYYCNVKKVISNYYDLRTSTFQILKSSDFIKTKNGKLIEYQDVPKGIIIKNDIDKGKTYKEYRSDGIEVVWKEGYVKTLEDYPESISKKIGIAEKAIQEVENQRY